MDGATVCARVRMDNRRETCVVRDQISICRRTAAASSISGNAFVARDFVSCFLRHLRP